MSSTEWNEPVRGRWFRKLRFWHRREPENRYSAIYSPTLHDDPTGSPPPYRQRERPCPQEKPTEADKAWAEPETTVQVISHAICTAGAAWAAKGTARRASKEERQAVEGMAAAIGAAMEAVCGLPRGLAGMTDVVAMWIKYTHETNTPYAERRAAGESPASLAAITTVHCATTYVKECKELSDHLNRAIPKAQETEMAQRMRKVINLVPAESGPRVTAAMHAAIAKVMQEVATTDEVARRTVATSYTRFAWRKAIELCP